VSGEHDLGAETVGERLRRLRHDRGLSQRDISAPGITYAYISRIEAGSRQPSMKALRALSSRLGVSVEYLETGAQLPASTLRELRLADHELQLRLGGAIDQPSLDALREDAESDGDPAGAARARILLGLAAAAAGDPPAAIAHLSAVLDSDLVTPSSRPDVYATLGHAYALAGQTDLAVALFEDALGALAVADPYDRAAEVRYTTYLSYALTDRGEIARAHALLARLWTRPGEPDDRITRVRLYWSLGRIALEEGRPLVALEQFRRALALLEVTEDELQLARAHLACAESALGAGEDDGVRAHLESAEALLAEGAARTDLATLARVQSLQAERDGDAEEAARLGERALALSEGLPAEQGRAWAALARALALGGEPAADGAFAEAIELLAHHGTAREYAEVLRLYGRQLRNSSREHEALDVFERAAEVAANLQGDRAGAWDDRRGGD
jgi:transcriptional regulator with XRE-family HTH domain